MSVEQNPLIPTGYDVTWSLIAMVAVILAVIALVVLARSAGRLTPFQGLSWTLLILLVPVLGPVAWLAIGRRTVAERATPGESGPVPRG